MLSTTICLLVREDSIYLPMKKRGFGMGNHNGYGGKKRADESWENAACRELFEESGVQVNPKQLFFVAELLYDFPHKPEWDQRTRVYLIHDWVGEPVESDEMSPTWFSINHLPLDKMWASDGFWLPPVLDKKYVRASFTYDANKVIVKKSLELFDDRTRFEQVIIPK